MTWVGRRDQVGDDMIPIQDTLYSLVQKPGNRVGLSLTTSTARSAVIMTVKKAIHQLTLVFGTTMEAADQWNPSR